MLVANFFKFFSCGNQNLRPSVCVVSHIFFKFSKSGVGFRILGDFIWYAETKQAEFILRWKYTRGNKYAENKHTYNFHAQSLLRIRKFFEENWTKITKNVENFMKKSNTFSRKILEWF